MELQTKKWSSKWETELWLGPAATDSCTELQTGTQRLGHGAPDWDTKTWTWSSRLRHKDSDMELQTGTQRLGHGAPDWDKKTWTWRYRLGQKRAVELQTGTQRHGHDSRLGHKDLDMEVQTRTEVGSGIPDWDMKLQTHNGTWRSKLGHEGPNWNMELWVGHRLSDWGLTGYSGLSVSPCIQTAQRLEWSGTNWTSVFCSERQGAWCWLQQKQAHQVTKESTK